MRTSISAQSAASVPPTPALMASTASRSSYGPESCASRLAFSTPARSASYSRSRSAASAGSSPSDASSTRSSTRRLKPSQRSTRARTSPSRLSTFCAFWRSSQRSGRADSASRRPSSSRRPGRSKEHRHAVDALAERGERLRIDAHGLPLARSLEGGHDRLGDGSELAGREAHEGDAGAVGVARAARAVAVTVERGAIGTLEAVVLADDPFLHAGMSLSLGPRRATTLPQQVRRSLVLPTGPVPLSERAYRPETPL